MDPEFEQILTSNLPELEKLTRTYRLIMRQQQIFSQNQIELHKTLGDEDALVKEQIKAGALKYSEEIFVFCYYRITGRMPIDE